jgi:hypothetical protein
MIKGLYRVVVSLTKKKLSSPHPDQLLTSFSGKLTAGFLE